MRSRADRVNRNRIVKYKRLLASNGKVDKEILMSQKMNGEGVDVLLEKVTYSDSDNVLIPKIFGVQNEVDLLVVGV